jgi:predicted amidohydrolase YtcJ
VVVRENLFELELDELTEAKVLLTMVEGEPVFTDPSFE